MEELTVEVFQAQFGSSDNQSLMLLEGIRGVRKARVYGSITAFPEYAGWLQGVLMAPVGVEVVAFDRERELVRRDGRYDLWTVSGFVS